jgi:hypothetical protein
MTGTIQCMRSRVTPRFPSISKTVSQTLLGQQRAASLRCSPRRVLTIHSSALRLDSLLFICLSEFATRFWICSGRLLRQQRAASLRCSPRRVLTIHSSALRLARIFHTDHLRKPGSQMDAALISKSSSGSVYTHTHRQTSSLALPHQPSRPPRRDQYAIYGLNSLLFICLSEFATRFWICSGRLLR